MFFIFSCFIKRLVEMHLNTDFTSPNQTLTNICLSTKSLNVGRGVLNCFVNPKLGRLLSHNKAKFDHKRLKMRWDVEKVEEYNSRLAPVLTINHSYFWGSGIFNTPVHESYGLTYYNSTGYGIGVFDHYTNLHDMCFSERAAWIGIFPADSYTPMALRCIPLFINQSSPV